MNSDHLPTRLLCNKIISNFNDETKLAGTDCMYGFPRRNPRISLRTSENTWAARASDFNRVSVKAFFDILGSLLNKFKLTPSRIYNWDKTGISTVPNKPTKIFSLKGKKTRSDLILPWNEKLWSRLKFVLTLLVTMFPRF